MSEHDISHLLSHFEGARGDGGRLEEFSEVFFPLFSSFFSLFFHLVLFLLLFS